MNKYLKAALTLLFSSFFVAINAQSSYRYSVDLNKVNNDQLTVELIAPAISKKNTGNTDFLSYFT